MSGWISMCNWREYQHADTTRSGGPLPWVKNYTRLMSDDDYLELTEHCALIFHRLLLVYASSSCRLRADTGPLSRRLGVRVTKSHLESLSHAGFIRIVASKEQAEGVRIASVRVARGEVEREELNPKAVKKRQRERPVENLNGDEPVELSEPPEFEVPASELAEFEVQA